jgi:hypothetical protein
LKRPAICIVYLVRACNSLAPLERFLQSYSRFSAGIEHDAVVVLKGFGDPKEASRQQELARQLSPQFLFMNDFGFDLRAYSLVCRRFDYPFFCFFNSFSEFLCDGWLQKMHEHITQNGVGLVGATGSHESMYTNVLLEKRYGAPQPLLKRLWFPIRLALCRACFDPFPNHHLRTNAFMISRDLMRAVWPRIRLTKRGAYLFENGRHGLAKQILRRALQVLVVGADGQAYQKERWPHSATFRSGDQKNLLVADNQTRQFDEADEVTRRYLTRVTWGIEQLS